MVRRQPAMLLLVTSDSAGNGPRSEQIFHTCQQLPLCPDHGPRVRSQPTGMAFLAQHPKWPHNRVNLP
jgi:hypothetical protein